MAPVPIYSRLDNRAQKGVKQFTFAALIIGGASFIISIRAFYVPPVTPFQKSVVWFAKKVFGVTFFGLFTFVYLVRQN